MSDSPLMEVVRAHDRGETQGITSICSANPTVIEASFAHAKDRELPLLIESTSNQVNQERGYTGYKPDEFMAYLLEVAEKHDFASDRLVLGGDHLGPNPWRSQPAARAMDKARVLVKAYVRAGYTKIHLDASMKLGDDAANIPLPEEIAADRAAELALVAERSAEEGQGRERKPFYVIGTEVPVPGGSESQEENLTITRPEAVAETIEITRRAFARRDLGAAWERVIAVVVQPGVEFGDNTLFAYVPERAGELARFIEGVDGLVYEAHSTDYQTAAALRCLVRDHFAILKVGPALTFAMREVIFALATIEALWLGDNGGASPSRTREVIEERMLADPRYWQDHYHGSPEEQRLARAYSFSDRIRYYWPDGDIQQALQRMLRNLSAAPIPLTLLSQFLPVQYKRVRAGVLTNEPRALIRDGIMAVLDDYADACSP